MTTRTLSPLHGWLRPESTTAPASLPSDPESSKPRVLWLWRGAAVVLCALHAFVARHTMNPDGISYLDLADAWRRGAWSEALNAYWSPLYSWLIAGTFALFRPAPFWECAVVHALNFVIFLAALAAFEFLLHEVLLCQRARRAAGTDERQNVLPAWVLVSLAYAAFLWISRQLITVSFVTPDMGVAALVYLAAALILRLRRRGLSRGGSVLLGLVLGLAYLAKAVMFPLGFVFLAVAASAAGSVQRAGRLLLPATLAFTLTAGPFVAALSLARGQFTFGDSGKLNYLWYVAGVPRPHFTGNQAAGRQPLHPPRRLFENPAVHEFAHPGMGTYPLWCNPAHWYEGVALPFDLGKQFAALGRVARDYAGLFFGLLSPVTLALLVLCVFARCGRALAREYPLLLPALACLGLYGLVGHVEGRLIGPFLVLIVLAVLLAIRTSPARAAGVPRLSWVLVLGLGLLLVANLVYDARNALAGVIQGEEAAYPDYRVTRYLQEHGLKAGTPVGSIGFTFSAEWARLGRYRVVVEIAASQSAKFWECPVHQKDVLDCFRRAGARVVVAEKVPAGAEGWTRIGGTGYSVLLLDESWASGAASAHR